MTAEDYLRARYGAYRGHFAWRELEEAFNAGRDSAESAAGTPPGEKIGAHGNQMATGQPQGATPGVTPGTEAGCCATAAWNAVRREARDLAQGRGVGDLLAAVDEFGAACAAAQLKPLPNLPNAQPLRFRRTPWPAPQPIQELKGESNT